MISISTDKMIWINIVKDKFVKAQKELSDGAALALIVFLVIGTLSYFVFNHWQRVSRIENTAEQVNAEQVAAKMAKEREDLRAVMNGKKKLEEVDAEALAAEQQEGMQKVAHTVQEQETAVPASKPEALKEGVKSEKKAVTSAADQVKAESVPTIVTSPAPPVASDGVGGAINQYSCSQKQQCSQMRSCAEAKFYAKQCSNTKIKPDENGQVCPQLCGG